MTLSNISVPDIMEVVQRWRREGQKKARSFIVLTHDPASKDCSRTTTADATIRYSLSRVGERKMLEKLFEEYPEIAKIAREILTSKKEDHVPQGLFDTAREWAKEKCGNTYILLTSCGFDGKQIVDWEVNAPLFDIHHMLKEIIRRDNRVRCEAAVLAQYYREHPEECIDTREKEGYR